MRFSEFATKNTALDIPTQGKAMIEAAATLEGQLIAAQTELEGLKPGSTRTATCGFVPHRSQGRRVASTIGQEPGQQVR